MASVKKKKPTTKKSFKSRNDAPVKKDNKKQQNKGGTKDKALYGNIIRYVLIVIAVLFMICFVSHVISGMDDESGNAFGFLGFWISNIFMGLFGHAVFAIPVLLALFTILWENYNRRSFLALNAVFAFISAILISALMHVFLHIGDGVEGFFYEVDILYEEGAALQGGGIVGGLLAFALVKATHIFGAIFLIVAALFVFIPFLAGTDPWTILKWIAGKIKAAIEAKKEEKALEDKEAKEQEKADKAHEKEQARLDREAEREQDRLDREAAREAAKAKREAARAEMASGKAKETPDGADNNGEEINTAAFDEEPAEKAADKPMEKVKLTVFSSETKSHNDSAADDDDVALDLTDLEIDELGAENVFNSNDDEDEGETVVFVDPKDTGKKARGHDAVDDLFNERFDENYAVNKETGEVFTPLVQNNSPRSAAEYEAMNNTKEDEYFIGDKPELPVIPEYQFPPVDLLELGPAKYASDQQEIEQNAEQLQRVLQDFRIPIKEISCSCGPTITRYEIKPEAGVRVKQIANLVDDISMALARSGVRIEAPIPGKAAVGIEVPNEKPSAVKLRNLIETPEFTEHKSKLASCLGADVSGKPVVFDIEKMPHLLVAGTTGSGKSVCINSIIMSILYHAKPNEVKLLLIDPKKVEFKIYKDIPHLCCRIISDPKKAAGALNSAVNEMEKRFELIEEVGVRNITGYNEATKNDPDKPYMPRMVIIIDEFADLMMTAKDEVETAVVRIAQKARAAGIHLIVGTQRPSVDVITGLIKANIPSRIAFTVMSQVDSRTILDGAGAEKLCGRGDMLYAPVGASKPQRVQGAFVSDDEVEAVVEYVKNNNAPVIYDQEFETSIDAEAAKCGNAPDKAAGGGEFKGGAGDEDPKLYDAAELAINAGKISTSLLQRRLEVGYGRAAKIIDRLEEMGFVGPADGNKPRKILITREELAEHMMNKE